MFPAPSKTDLNAETASLCRLTGVAGLLLQKGENIIANRLPFSDRRMLEVAEQIRAMCAGYQGVGRTVRQVLFVFDAGAFLVVNRQNAQLALMLGLDADVDMAASAVAAFMTDHAAALTALSPQKNTNRVSDPVLRATPESVETTAVQTTPSNLWPEVRKCLEGVLGKAMGRAQVNNLIDRVLKATGVTDVADLTLNEARSVALSVLAEVPNRTKRQSLEAELEDRIADLKNKPKR